jgi:CAAX protease family protein
VGPQLLDHLFFVVLAFLVPFRARFSLRRLERATVDDLPRVRMRSYRMILAFQWGLALILLAYWWLQRRSWDDLGLVPRINGGAIGVAVGIAIVIGIGLAQRRSKPDDATWERLRKRMRKIERLLPRTAAELRWFELVSITAGVCEELLYRGFLIWYLSHWMSIVPAAFLAAAIFGIAHLYQGIGGILRTGALGGFLASIYLLTRSLYLPMVLHFLADVYSGHVMYEAYQRERAEAAPAAAAPEPST